MSDVLAANDAVNSGRLGSIFEKVSQLLKPESTFFYSDQGHRAAIILFDMNDASMMPLIAEPFFTELNAKVEFLPGMSPAELTKGLNGWKEKAPSFTSLS